MCACVCGACARVHDSAVKKTCHRRLESRGPVAVVGQDGTQGAEVGLSHEHRTSVCVCVCMCDGMRFSAIIGKEDDDDIFAAPKAAQQPSTFDDPPGSGRNGGQNGAESAKDEGEGAEPVDEEVAVPEEEEGGAGGGEAPVDLATFDKDDVSNITKIQAKFRGNQVRSPRPRPLCIRGACSHALQGLTLGVFSGP